MLYPNCYAQTPLADSHVCQLVLAPKTVFTFIIILQQEDQTKKKIQATFSWLQSIPCTANLLHLTTNPNFSQCLFCTSLFGVLLAAVPISILLHDPLALTHTKVTKHSSF